MFLVSQSARSKIAFSVIRTSFIIARSNRVTICPRHLSYLYRSHPLQSVFSHPLYHPALAFASIALPSRPLRFDKVPNRLPDWWDDDDDDDEEDTDQGDQAFDDGSDSPGDGGRDGGRGGSGGGGGGGDWDDDTKDGLFATILAMYTHAVVNAPIRTKAISTCLLALLGDYIAQRIAHRHKVFVWDRRRSASVGIWGLCFMGPALHSWYAILDRLFSGRFSVWQKLFSDQIFFAPFFNGAFIAGIGTLEGMSREEVIATLKSKLWPSMKANWTLWPAAQFVNFAFIPKTFQIVYVNSIALVWNAILTYISHDQYETDLAEIK